MKINMPKEMWIDDRHEGWESEPTKIYNPVKYIRASDVQPLIDALRFYAAESEWYSNEDGNWRLKFNSRDYDGHGYERARKALKAFDETT